MNDEATPAPFSPFGANPGTPPITGDDPVEVELPSGSKLHVLTVEEAFYLDGQVRDYNSQLSLTNVSDLAELDRIVTMELLIHRAAKFLMLGRDYEGKKIDRAELNQLIKQYDVSIRSTKKALGIDKVARDRARGEGSAYQRITSILERGKKLGYVRNAQAAKAIELAMQMIALVEWHDHCEPHEQELQHVTSEDVLEWVRTVFRPEFMAIDEHFRDREVRYWTRT